MRCSLAQQYSKTRPVPHLEEGVVREGEEEEEEVVEAVEEV